VGKEECGEGKVKHRNESECGMRDHEGKQARNDDLMGVPDSTAVRVALWRAQHVEVDALPHVFVDEVGLRLAPHDENWRARPDMDAERMRLFRASIVGRARFVEDPVVEQVERGVGQYVILGAGLYTFA
jgi:O-methyltransferase involved in polyketide biosynthesis